jgi:hypothetical protein
VFGVLDEVLGTEKQGQILFNSKAYGYLGYRTGHLWKCNNSSSNFIKIHLPVKVPIFELIFSAIV